MISQPADVHSRQRQTRRERRAAPRFVDENSAGALPVAFQATDSDGDDITIIVLTKPETYHGVPEFYGIDERGRAAPLRSDGTATETPAGSLNVWFEPPRGVTGNRTGCCEARTCHQATVPYPVESTCAECSNAPLVGDVAECDTACCPRRHFYGELTYRAGTPTDYSPTPSGRCTLRPTRAGRAHRAAGHHRRRHRGRTARHRVTRARRRPRVFGRQRHPSRRRHRHRVRLRGRRGHRHRDPRGLAVGRGVRPGDGQRVVTARADVPGPGRCRGRPGEWTGVAVRGVRLVRRVVAVPRGVVLARRRRRERVDARRDPRVRSREDARRDHHARVHAPPDRRRVPLFHASIRASRCVWFIFRARDERSNRRSTQARRRAVSFFASPLVGVSTHRRRSHARGRHRGLVGERRRRGGVGIPSRVGSRHQLEDAQTTRRDKVCTRFGRNDIG